MRDVVDAGHEPGVAHPSDAAALEVEDPHAHQFGEKEQCVGHVPPLLRASGV